MTQTAHSVEDAIAGMAEKPLGNVKVLMVEDDTFLSGLVLEKLSTQGCIPYSCQTGEEAVDLATQYQPDVIILDLMLPGVSGEEVLETLKSNAELKHIPVIVFSNKSEASDIAHVKSLGAAEYLVKSATDLNDIANVIKNVRQ